MNQIHSIEQQVYFTDRIRSVLVYKINNMNVPEAAVIVELSTKVFIKSNSGTVVVSIVIRGPVQCHHTMELVI